MNTRAYQLRKEDLSSILRSDFYRLSGFYTPEKFFFLFFLAYERCRNDNVQIKVYIFDVVNTETAACESEGDGDCL